METKQMEQVISNPEQIHARRLALALTGVSLLAPVLGLMGWLCGLPLLASYGGKFIPMAPSTGVCFIVLASIQFWRLSASPAPGANRGVELAGWVIAAYGFLVFFASLSGLPLNPDNLLLGELGSLGGYRLGRMSPITGFLFLLTGIAQSDGVHDQSRARSANLRRALAPLASAIVLLSGAIFTLGYALGAPLLYESSYTIPLALPTAITFLLLGGGMTITALFYSPLTDRWRQRLKDMPIGLQLRLGLGLILAFVILIGSMADRKSDLMFLQVKTMYDHPLKVRRAICILGADIMGMRLEMRNLLAAGDDRERESALVEIEIHKLSAGRQLAILEDLYLGPPRDLVTLRNEFATWDTIRTETIRLLRAGKRSEALARSKPGGVGISEAERVQNQLKTIDEFARTKGDQLYQAALAQNESLNREIIVIVSLILLFSLLVAWLLMEGIKNPLKQLTAAAEQFREGRLETRSKYSSDNEFGALSAAFNAMAETVASQMRINGQAAELAEIMVRESEARPFCRALLQALVAHTGSQIGAIYLLNRQKTEFEHFESLGLGEERRASFSAHAREGEFGLALASGKMHRLSDIPADTAFTFTTVSGQLRPREIVTLPLQSGQETVAIISLANLRGYDAHAIRLLETVLAAIAARTNGVLLFRRGQELAERLERQNIELLAQQQEMSAQAQELTSQNIELERQKEQLDAANRLKSAFLSNMSHELRTPLNSVIALSGVLRRRLEKSIPEDEFGYLEVIERNGRNLLAMINDILDLSRIEAGREEFNLGQFSLHALVDEVVEMIAPQAREKEIILDNQVSAGLPALTSDSDKIRHILQNLVGNAVKFIEAGSVTISARQVGAELEVAVRDTGIGIAAEQLPHIFEEFRQADDSNSRKYGGSGLGLTIAKKYATLLHGAITVESTPGQGSTFTLRLPLDFSAAGARVSRLPPDNSGPALAQPLELSAQGQTILLVEDNEPAVIQISDILLTQGYRVRVARNGQEALAQIELALPEAMILDLMMPEMDGFEVLKQLRASERSFSLPVLILTAKHVTKEELSVLKGNHIHQLIQKGDIGRKALLEAVARMVTPAEEKFLPPPRRRRALRPGKPLILVVEDNPDNLLTVQALLKESYELIAAEDGLAGLEQARLHQPDLILMDLALPLMDGFAALAALRAEEDLAHIPVVALTARAMKGDRETILAHGFDGYISKPIDAELLRHTLREVLDERQ